MAMQTQFIRYFARCFSTSDVTLNKVQSCGRSPILWVVLPCEVLSSDTEANLMSDMDKNNLLVINKDHFGLGLIDLVTHLKKIQVCRVHMLNPSDPVLIYGWQLQNVQSFDPSGSTWFYMQKKEIDLSYEK